MANWNGKHTLKEFDYINTCNKKASNARTRNFCVFIKALAFPTAEMRDTFYENFKDLIEQCKELL